MQQETEYQPMTGCPQRLHELVTMEMDPCGLQAKVFSLHIAAAGGDAEGGQVGRRTLSLKAATLTNACGNAMLQICRRANAWPNPQTNLFANFYFRTLLWP